MDLFGYSKSSNFLEFLWICQFKNVKNHLKSQNIQYLYLHKHKNWLFCHLKKISILNMAIKSKNHIIFCIFLTNNVHLLIILFNNLLSFLFLELFFTHKNSPPNVWNSKMGLKSIFFGNTLYLLHIDNSWPLHKLHESLLNAIL